MTQQCRNMQEQCDNLSINCAFVGLLYKIIKDERCSYQNNMLIIACPILCVYRGADNSLARPTSRCILFDGQNISFDASLVYKDIYIYTNIPPIMTINRIYETQNLLSLQLVSFLVGLRTYQHHCTCSEHQCASPTDLFTVVPHICGTLEYIYFITPFWRPLLCDGSQIFRKLFLHLHSIVQNSAVQTRTVWDVMQYCLIYAVFFLENSYTFLVCFLFYYLKYVIPIFSYQKYLIDFFVLFLVLLGETGKLRRQIILLQTHSTYAVYVPLPSAISSLVTSSLWDCRKGFVYCGALRKTVHLARNMKCVNQQRIRV